MTIDDIVMQPFYNININYIILDPCCPKFIHNQNNDNSLDH